MGAGSSGPRFPMSSTPWRAKGPQPPLRGRKKYVGWFASGSQGAHAQQVPNGRSLTAIEVRNLAMPGSQGSYFLQDSKTVSFGCKIAM
jgi:hypothetical protein